MFNSSKLQTRRRFRIFGVCPSVLSCTDGQTVVKSSVSPSCSLRTDGRGLSTTPHDQKILSKSNGSQSTNGKTTASAQMPKMSTTAFVVAFKGPCSHSPSTLYSICIHKLQATVCTTTSPAFARGVGVFDSVALLLLTVGGAPRRPAVGPDGHNCR